MAARSAWDLGKLVDLTVLGSSSDAQVGLRYEALAELIEDDPNLHRLYVGIWHLIDPVSALEEQAIQERLDEIAATH